MKEIDQAIAQTAHDLLADHRVTLNEAVTTFIGRYEALVLEHANDLALCDIRTRFKRIFRTWEEKENGQPELPGLQFPMAIIITPPSGESYWVNTAKAVWDELLAGLAVREANITAAVKRRDDYLDSVDRVRPWMEHHPARTVEEALHLMHNGGKRRRRREPGGNGR